jgi:hypothetical protein
MPRDRRGTDYKPGVAELERRDLLSLARVPVVPAFVGEASPPHVIRPADFHHAYVTSLTSRLQVSTDMTVRISNAFQAFVQNFLGIPLADQAAAFSGGPAPAPPGGTSPPGTTPPGGPPNLSGVTPVGTIPNPPTLANLITQLTQQVDFALSTIVLTTRRVQPSVAKGPKFSPRAFQALIPFANAELAQLGQVLAANPPAFNPNGSLTSRAPLHAVNTAFNNILNAVAENSVHPNLFLSPSDFYINPLAKFTIPFTSAPAGRAPNYVLLGPHGVPLPGVAGRPHP